MSCGVLSCSMVFRSILCCALGRNHDLTRRFHNIAVLCCSVLYYFKLSCFIQSFRDMFYSYILYHALWDAQSPRVKPWSVVCYILLSWSDLNCSVVFFGLSPQPQPKVHNAICCFVLLFTVLFCRIFACLFLYYIVELCYVVGLNRRTLGWSCDIVCCFILSYNVLCCHVVCCRGLLCLEPCNHSLSQRFTIMCCPVMCCLVLS